MSFCPQCGAPTSPGLSFCTACGRTLTPGSVTPAPAPAFAAPSTAGFAPTDGPTRPVGKTVEPWIVVLLGVVTFGIYPLVLWWRASREVDAFVGSDTHPRVRIGVFLGIAALVVGTILFAYTMARTMSELLADPDGYDPEVATAAFASNPIYLALAAAQLATALVLYPALGRTWHALAAEETRLGRQDPVNPSSFVVIGIAATVANAASAVSTFLLAPRDPTLNGIASFILGMVALGFGIALLWVMYATQKHLNELWRTAMPRPAGWG